MAKGLLVFDQHSYCKWVETFHIDSECKTAIYVLDYLNGIREIQDTNALYSIDPLQKQEWARK